jgi:cytidylate kinase
VIVGRGADYILRDYEKLVSVFIHADLEVRAKRVAEYEKCSIEKARELVLRSDKKRASYYNFQTEKKWGHASSYHLSIDSGATGYEGAVELIRDFVRIREKNW